MCLIKCQKSISLSSIFHLKIKVDDALSIFIKSGEQRNIYIWINFSLFLSLLINPAARHADGRENGQVYCSTSSSSLFIGECCPFINQELIRGIPPLIMAPERRRRRRRKKNPAGSKRKEKGNGQHLSSWTHRSIAARVKWVRGHLGRPCFSFFSFLSFSLRSNKSAGAPFLFICLNLRRRSDQHRIDIAALAGAQKMSQSRRCI